MNEDITFGQVVKERRSNLGLTQTELARRVGCAAITIRKIEADDLRPSVQMAELIALALDIPEAEQLAFVRLARADLRVSPIPTPTPMPDEIGLEDLSGRAVKGFELGEKIGSGGFGVVYRARQPSVDRDVAIKIILPRYANHPNFIRRFEAEAQLVARLEHPHIVPLYDYWREPGAAYLIMRLLRGGSLEDEIRQGPLPIEKIHQYIHQIGLALDVAHRNGVIHRDIKPANVLLDEENNAYLADFGIAKNLEELHEHSVTEDGVLIGSPAYISPEQIMAEPVKPQSDMYCLGIMLFEMLTGHKPFVGPTPVAFIQQHLNESLPSLQKHNPDLPKELDAVIFQAAARNIADRFPDMPSFLQALGQALPTTFTTTTIPSAIPIKLGAQELAQLENPYKGLRAFAEVDAEHFYGRATLIQELFTQLSAPSDLARFLAIVGPSGSGKSSVAKAGLIPALRRGGLPGSENWFILDFTPGAHPWEELETALLRIAVNPPETLLNQLQDGDRGLLRTVRRVLPDDDNVELVLIIDQFEELFTLVADEAVREQFFNGLVMAVLDKRSRLRVILTLRADFYDRPLQYVDFGDLLRQRTVSVLPMTPDELERAITQPALQTGIHLEPGLAEAIIHDVGDQPGSLPLLQYALTELFEQRDRAMMTHAAYEKAGGITGALARRADEIYEGLDEDGRAAARQLFLRLITLGEGIEDTRRRVRLAELEELNITQTSSLQSPVSNLVHEYGRHRLLTFDRDPFTREPTVEVAHEAILREWPRLRAWLDESRADIRLQRILAAATAEWLEAGRDEGFLLHGSRLDMFADWAAEADIALTADETACLEASLTARQHQEIEEKARQQRELETVQQLAETEKKRAEEQTSFAQNLRRRAVYLSAALVVAAILAIIAIIASRQSNQNALAAQHQAAILLASESEAQLEQGFSDRAVLLALEALQNYPYTPQAEAALGRAVSYNRAWGQYMGHETAVTSVDWSPDGDRIASTSSDNTVHIWHAATGETQRIIPLPEGITGNMLDMGLTVKWLPDGKTLAVLTGDRYMLGSQDYDLSLWDAATGKQIAAVEIANEAEAEQEGSGTTATFTHYTTSAALDVAKQNGQLASIGGDNTALIWETDLTKPVLTLTGHEDDVNSIQWSPDESQLATASLDGTARIWDAQTGAELLRFEGHEGQVTTARWSPDGAYLATAGGDGQICTWITSNGEVENCIQSNAGQIWSLVWSADGSRLISGHEDSNIRIWDVASGQLLETLAGHDGPVVTLARLAEEEKLVSGGGNKLARVWNIAPSTAAVSFPSWASLDPDWSGDGRYLALPMGDIFAGSESPGIAIWDMQEETMITENLTSDMATYWWAARYSPDNTRLLLRGSDVWPDILPKLLTASVIDATSGELLTTFSASDDENWLRDASWSPDGSQVAGAKINGEIHIWDYATGNLITTLLHGEGSFVNEIEWSPDGSKIASASDDGIAQVWDAVTWEHLFSLTNHEPPTFITMLAWSPDGSRLLTVAGNDDLGATDTTARIWDAKTGDQLLVITGHTRQVFWGSWSPDGSRIATASHDDTTRIWDAITGDELLLLDTPNFFGTYAKWSPTGEYIATSGYGQQAEIWRVWQTTEELIAYAQECCLIRELTSEERDQFGLAPEK